MYTMQELFMKLKAVLESIGLTKIEVKVYLALLEYGPTLASIISRKSGIHRRCVYDAVERLIKRGLAGYIVKNNRKYFSATNPDRLLSIVKEQEEDLNRIIPELQKIHGRSTTKPETSFYQGMNGLKNIYEDILDVGEDVLLIGATTYKDVNRFFFPRFDRERKSKKIKIRILFPESMRKDHPNVVLAKIKYLPESHISNVATNIYGDNVAISIWTKDPIAILIRQKEIADSYRKQFEILWKIAKK